MLKAIKEMFGYEIEAKDGTIGAVSDVLFDDGFWTARYLVADTRKWLPGRRVLLSPESFRGSDWSSKRVAVNLTKEQIEESPPIEADAPIHRQVEEMLAEHYRWPAYWSFSHPVGSPLIPPEAQLQSPSGTAVEAGDPHLRSVKEVAGYHVRAKDGDIGHVEDFVVDDDGWVVRYLVVDTKNILPGRKVLMAPSWVKNIGWSEGKVFVGLTRKEIEESPEFDPAQPINREYEVRLYDFYGRPRYWA